MYKELLIFPESIKGQPMYPDTVRSLVSKACDGIAINPEIFARQADGKTIQRVFGHTADGEGFGAIPSICFGGGNGLIRLYGIGKSGRQILTESAGTILTAVSALLNNTPCRFEVKSGDCEIGDPDGGGFKIRNLVVAKKRYQYAEFAEKRMPTLVEMTPLIKRAIVRGIIGQAMMLDEETGSRHADRLPTDDMLDIKIFEGKPVFMPTKAGKKGCVLGVQDLVFSMNLSLSGPWFVGHLRSRGFGLIQSGKVAR